MRDAADTIRELGEECSEKRDNMPDQLQDCGSGELLEGRANACESLSEALETAADEIELLETDETIEAKDCVELDVDREDFKSDEEFEVAIEDARNELKDERDNEIDNTVGGIDWTVE